MCDGGGSMNYMECDISNNFIDAKENKWCEMRMVNIQCIRMLLSLLTRMSYGAWSRCDPDVCAFLLSRVTELYYEPFIEDLTNKFVVNSYVSHFD